MHPRDTVRRLGHAVWAVVRRFHADACLLHASALTYTSLLSLVPLLALMFAVLKGLGVQRRLEPVLLSHLSLSPEATHYIVTYIDQTNVGTLGMLGACALVFTVVSVLGSIEGSFNHIWRVRSGRIWWRKASDYVSTVILTPFLLLTAVAITSSLQEQAVLRWVLQTEYIGPAALQVLGIAPIVMTMAALAILYTVMPNRRPYFPAVLVAAVIAGIIWHGVQWAYVALQVGVAQYNAIYGALAQLPVTLVWIYVSWVVVLLGAEIAAVCEFGPDWNMAPITPSARRAVALHLLVQAGEHLRGTAPMVAAPRVARDLHIDRALVDDIAAELCAVGLLARVDATRDAYVLARDPRSIDLVAVAAAVRHDSVPPGCDPRVHAFAAQLDAVQQAALQQRTLAALLNGSQRDDTVDSGPRTIGRDAS